jgi:hypothetical protein
MDCPECGRLTDEFARRERLYASARGILTASSSIVVPIQHQFDADERRMEIAAQQREFH